MNVLVVDDAEWAPRVASIVGERRAGAAVLLASCAAEARAHAEAREIDVLVLEPAIPELPGGRLVGTQERLTVRHEVVQTGFPGLRLAGWLVARRPGLRLFVHTALRPDHPDVLALWDLGAEVVAHKLARRVPVAAEDDIAAALAGT